MTLSMFVLAIAILALGFGRIEASTTAAALSSDAKDPMPASTVSATTVAEAPEEPGAGLGVDAETDIGPDPTTDPEKAVAPALHSGTGIVRFVYFVEADQEFEEEAVDRIERQGRALQQFWFEQFGGTFFLPEAGVEVVYGRHPAAWYDETVTGDDPRWHRLLNMRAEVWESIGVAVDEDVRLVVYPAARIDGRVGANRYGSVWMDGDDLACIDGGVPTVPYSQQFPADCLTTVAHELGHVYGLGHEGAESDCMQLGFYRYVSGEDRCTFSQLARQTVQADPRNTGWLDARPGDRR